MKLYDDLPTIECKGLCAGTCGFIPVSPTELRNIRKVAKKRIRAERFEYAFLLRVKQDGTCPLLEQGNRCSIHEHRPLMCRLYGIAEGMECQHGCKPSPRYLTKKEAGALMERAGLLVR